MSRNSDQVTASLIYKLGRRIDALETRPRIPYPWGDLVTELTRRIEALEARQTPLVGDNPSDSHGTKTEATVKATAAIVVTPPTITSKTTTNTDQPTGLGSEAEWERQWALHAALKTP